MNIENIVKNVDNEAIFNSLVITNSKINSPLYNNVMCSISGGSDSDIMLDLIHKVDIDKKTNYVFFDTGLEYQATKEHLKELEEKYNIEIKREKAVKSIPICCREYGQPFISKIVSERIEVLQRYGFKFEDKPFEELIQEYCIEVPREKAILNRNLYVEVDGKFYRGCCAPIRWWCNGFARKDGVLGKYNIGYNKYLKEFMVANPPTFRISGKCCTYAKKKVSSNYQKNNNIDLNIYGVRKSEGGARASAYKNCFSEDVEGVDEYRPIFWYKNEDKRDYENTFNIVHSKCYSEYGLKRTGCAGCPFGRDFEKEVEIIEKYEPKLYKAVLNIFGESYEYTRKYKEFCKNMKKEATNDRRF